MTVKNSILSRSPATFAPAQQPKPQDIAPLFAQGLALHQAGRLAEAEAVYHQVLAARPGHFDSLHLLGVIYLQRGNHAKAVQQIDLALKVDPDNVPALNNRGNALNDLRRFDDALASFDRVLRLKPDNAEAHSGRGNTLKELGRYDEALADYDRALALRPDYAQAHSNRASALHALSLFEDALAACDRALALQADFAGALSNRGNALKELGRYEAAIESYDRAIALQPAFAEAHSNRGNALHELHRFEDALAGYDRALALRPDFAEAHSNRGNALQELRRHDEAVASYDRALLLRPDMAEVHSNRGNALTELRQFERALESFDRAQALRPDLADAHFNAALCRLLTGDFVRGWEEYEWRWGTAQLKDARRNFARQQWSGSEQIAGKTILVHAEQGFGDTLQFCRYVPHLAARGARVILEVQKPLHSLMSTLSGAAQIVSRGDRLPHFDLHSPLLSLPRAFGTKPGTIPSDTPYLSASAGKTAAWRARLGDDDRLRVGLVWAGSSRKELPNAARIDRQRSIAFDRLAAGFAGDRLRVLQPAKRRRAGGAVARERARPRGDRLDRRAARLLRHRGSGREPRHRRCRRYRGRAPRRRAGQAVSADESLQHLLALAARPGRQPLVSGRAPVPAGRNPPLGTGHRSRRRRAPCVRPQPRSDGPAAPARRHRLTAPPTETAIDRAHRSG